MQRGSFRNTLLTSIEIQQRKFSTAGYISECHYNSNYSILFSYFWKGAQNDVSVALVRPFLFSLENEILTAVQVLCRIHSVLPTPLKFQTRHIWQHCNPKNKFVLQNLHQRYHRCGWSWRWIIWRRFEYFTILRLLVCCGSIVFAFVTIR